MTVARSKEEGLEAIRALVATFEANAAHYRSRDFDETSTRTAFVDRLFEALGWDVTSAAPDREVVFHARHTSSPELAGDSAWDEDLSADEIEARGEQTDIPDYSFHTAGELRFCVEAKRPHTGIRGRTSVFQVKTYAWNRKLTFSVITDFDSLRVYTTATRPDRNRPEAGLLAGYDLRHTEYVAHWDALWTLLSRESVTAGSSERRAAAARPRGAVGVGESFLRDLETWRAELGSDLLRRHPDLTVRELGEATQRILDRLVFIRVVEDRQVEPAIVLKRYARLPDAYRALCGEFRRLDAVYNGQLFAEHHSERLEVSDGLITRLIAGLYTSGGSPYRFDAFRADFLGEVYERFLGKHFEITGHTAKLVDKPEVRHAGGVYYTPRWVVDHMVSSALDPFLAGRRPNQVAELKIVDPACGSGTFLLGVFDRLVRWHEEYYTQHPTQDRDRHYVDGLGRTRLTSDFKGRILVNNVHGVDIDPQAVEVAQMSLYLRVLEEETSATLNAQRRLFEAAHLPSLSRNVRAGNSLLETADVPAELATDFEARRHLNPFDWRDETRGFGAVMSQRGGFDVVLGNPPYTRVQALRRFHPEQAALVEKRYSTATSGFDLATVFTERGLELLRPHASNRTPSVLTYITTRTFTETDAATALRSLLSRGGHVDSVIDFGAGRVFPEAGAYTVVLTLRARRQSHWRLTRVPAPPDTAALADALTDPVLNAELPGQPPADETWTLSLPAEDLLLRRLSEKHPNLADVSGDSIFQGVITGADGVFRATDVGPDPDDPERRLVRPFAADPDSEPLAAELRVLRPVYAGKSDFEPFRTAQSSEWMILPYSSDEREANMTLVPFATLQREAPNVAAWLRNNEETLRGRAGTWIAGNWYSYSRRQNLEKFQGDKVLVPSMLDRLCATYDTSGHYFVNVSTGGYGIGNDPEQGADPEYVAALLNSTLLTWVLRRMSRAWRGGWFEARKGNLGRLPIAVPEAARQQELVSMYREVVAAVTASADAPDDADRARLAASARQAFDHTVAALYGLSFVERDLAGI